MLQLVKPVVGGLCALWFCHALAHCDRQCSAADRTIVPGRAQVRAIEALRAIQPSGRFARAITGLVQAACKRRLTGNLCNGRYFEKDLAGTDALEDEGQAAGQLEPDAFVVWLPG